MPPVVRHGPSHVGSLLSSRRTLLAIAVVLSAAASAVVFLQLGNGTGDTPRTTAALAPAANDVPRIADLDGLDPRLRASLDAAIARAERERSAAAFGALGRLYNAHHYLDQARLCYEVAQGMDPADAEWPYHLGLLAAERGDVESAIPLLQRVVVLRPDYLPALSRLGDLLLAVDRLDEAAAAYSAAAVGAPEAPWGELGLGKVELRRGAQPLALAHLEHALDLAPSHAETRYLLATVHRDLGRKERAAELLRGLERGVRPERPPDPLLRRVLDQRQDLQANIAAANALLAAGRASEAEALYLEVLEYDPAHYDAHYDLGVLYGRSGRYEEARAALEAAVAARPTSADARVALALAHVALGQLDPARREAARALELAPGDERPRRLLEGLHEARPQI
jgi:tetratricopeptide (TPR) repeat protein